jgi:hypothetical protein
VMAEAKQKKRKTRGENYPPGNKLTQPCSNWGNITGGKSRGIGKESITLFRTWVVFRNVPMVPLSRTTHPITTFFNLVIWY